MSVYATREDLHRYGLPRGLLANPGQLLAAVHVASSALELDSHGFGEGTELYLRAEAGGSLPAPLAAGTTYFAIPVTESRFQVSATRGGAPVTLTTTGANIVVATSVAPVISAELETASRFVDSYLVAHQVPLDEPYPSLVVSTVAKLAAVSVLARLGQLSEALRLEDEKTRAELPRLMRGVPLRDTRATAPANLAVARSAADYGRGWGPTGGTIP